MMMVTRLHARAESMPPRRRLWSASVVGTAYFLCGMVAAAITTPPMWKAIFAIGWLVLLVVFGILSAGLTASLAPEHRRRLLTLRNAASAAAYLGLTLLAGVVLTFDRAGGMLLLFLVAVANYFFTRTATEEPISMDRLHRRITRRVAFRIIAIASAAIALSLLVTLARNDPAQQNSNFTVITGTFFAAGGAALKVHSHARKLSTQIDEQAGKLIHGLDSLRSAAPAHVASCAEDARLEWRRLNSLLKNRIETGLPLHGTPILPIENRRRLEGMVNMALADTPQGALFYTQARGELYQLAQACVPRVDSTL